MARQQVVEFREVLDIRRVPDTTEDFIGDEKPRTPTIDERWQSGTDANESDLVANDFALSIAASGTESFDLNSLAKGPGGATVVFAEIRAIFIRARSTNGSTVTVDPNASNGWTALGASFSLSLPAGMLVRLWSPADGSLPVSGSDKVLDFTNDDGAAAAIIDVTIIGVSA